MYPAKRNCSSKRSVKRRRAPRGKLARHVLAPRVLSYTALRSIVYVKEMRRDAVCPFILSLSPSLSGTPLLKANTRMDEISSKWIN